MKSLVQPCKGGRAFSSPEVVLKSHPWVQLPALPCSEGAPPRTRWQRAHITVFHDKSGTIHL